MESVMERRPIDNEEASAARRSHDWARLIRKLRWIGLDDEARRLGQAVSTLPPEERGCVSAEPFSTDLAGSLGFRGLGASIVMAACAARPRCGARLPCRQRGNA